MSEKVIVVAGYGPGVSNAVAEKFGALGYKVALLARTQSKLDEAVKVFAGKNITAKGFATDLADAAAVKKTIASIQAFGQIGLLFWNPYGASAGILDASAESLTSNFNLTTTSLIIAVQAALEDLKKTKGAVLVTGGGLSLENPQVVSIAVAWNAATLAIAKSAQRKAVNLINETLKPQGVYCGEVTIIGSIKGTPFDDGTATLTAEKVADAFAALNTDRTQVFTMVQ
ncbi:hypothetical protein HDU97_005000 [Phlyctochytrium planicorne]|nr:hypothetical protein HDU97_005000 [Phlyctochytrium planicorne]